MTRTKTSRWIAFIAAAIVSVCVPASAAAQTPAPNVASQSAINQALADSGEPSEPVTTDRLLEYALPDGTLWSWLEFLFLWVPAAIALLCIVVPVIAAVLYAAAFIIGAVAFIIAFIGAWTLDVFTAVRARLAS